MKRKLPNVFSTPERGLKVWICDARYHLVKQEDGTFQYGKKERFKTEELARGRADEIYNAAFQSELKIERLPQDVLIEAKRGLDLLRPLDGNLFDACQRYAEYLKARKDNVTTLQKAVTDWITYKDKQKLTKSTMSGYKTPTDALVRKHGEKLLIDVEHDTVYGWLHGLTSSNANKAAYCGALNQFFEWCIFPKKWIKENPCKGIEFKSDYKEPQIFSVDEARTLFTAAKKSDPDIFRHVVLCMFAGLRPESEAASVKKEDVNKDTNAIRVHSGKTKRLRYFQLEKGVCDLLLASDWKDEPQSNFRRRWDSLRYSLGYVIWMDPKYELPKRPDGVKLKKWPHDVMRHTYCSYHLAAFENEAQTAFNAGHKVEVLRNHYKRPIPKAEGEAFWQLLS